MGKTLLGSHSFKVRVRVSLGIVLVVILGALTPGMIGLRAVYGIAAILSIWEVYAILTDYNSPVTGAMLAHASISVITLLFSVFFVQDMPSALLIAGVTFTMASDTGAYLVGKICGTKFIHARPFPATSPQKSWEGLIGGVLAPGLITPLLNCFSRTVLHYDRALPIWIGGLMGVCAILGDLNESRFKRLYGVKDANDVLKHRHGFRHIEALLGGTEGHGGYYDRLDSMSLVMSMLYLVTALYFYLSSV